MRIIDNRLPGEVSVKAKDSPRLRMKYNLRTQAFDGDPGWKDTSQRMLNVLRDEAMEMLYDSSGREVERYHLEAGSESIACHVPKGQYHTCKSLKNGTVILEFKTGRYDPVGTEEILSM